MQNETTELESENEIKTELEKKERLIQTFIVLYGLLLAYNQNLDDVTRGKSLICLVAYLFLAMEYYRLITLPENKRLKIKDYTGKTNTAAIGASFIFGITVAIYSYTLAYKIDNSVDILLSSSSSIMIGISIAIVMSRALKI